MNDAPLNRSSWSQISPYLDEALELKPDEREQWLAQLASTQPQIVDTVRAFLAECAAVESRGFLETSPLSVTRLESLMPVLEEALRRHTGVESADWLQKLPEFTHGATAHTAGMVLGPYRLIREIGHGGMSSVWLAERFDGQLKRPVALKLPYEGPRRAQLAERLQRERDILATLTHPNIARLYDAGLTASGQPYLALEYVQGTTLTRYCDAARLSIRERLKVFQQVLAAVEFAHEQLVLHRDLKPSNILVTEHGRVVLLDFGIAKLLSQEIDRESPLTELPGRLLTPDYASPEHIAGQALGTPSDIYSLGVVLCELLAGSRPFSRHESRQAFEEAILKQDPPKPSQLEFTDEIAAARGTTPRKLLHALQGDLDTIVLKTLKKSPAERYRSVATFEQDIANYLGNLPVSARPDSAWYRTRRFAWRHKLPVAAATVTFLAVLGGAVTSIWQARVAAQERDRALALASRNEAINDFTGTLIADAAASQKPVTVSEMLARSEALALADTSGTPEDRAAILGMIAERYHGAGDNDKAAKLFERALALVRDSHDDELRSKLICDHAYVIYEMGQTELATQTITAELDNLKPGSRSAAICLLHRSYIADDQGDAEGTLRYALQGLESFRAIPRAIAADEGALLSAVATGYRLTGNSSEADRYFQLALRKFTDHGRGSSAGAIVIRSSWAALLGAVGDPRRASDVYDEVFKAARERDPGASPLASLTNNRARTLELSGRFSQARDAYESCRQLADEQKDVMAQDLCLLGLASIAAQGGDRAAAEDYLRQFDKRVGSSLPPDSPTMIRRTVIQGRLDLAAGNLDAAHRQFELALAKKGKNGGTIDATLEKAEVELLSGNMAAAMSDAQTALDIATELQSAAPYSNRTGLCWLTLGRVLQKQGDIVQARKAFESAVGNLSNTVDADHPALLRARQLLSSTS